MDIPRFILAGTQSGVGKTTISTGIMAALLKRDINIQPFKVGPDYIDPAFHTFITGNKSRNLDSWMLENQMVVELFLRNSQGKDLAVIEGVMGLYDGSGSEKEKGSTAHISKLLKAPVILILNGKGMAASAAAQVLGYKLYDPGVEIKGVLINNVSGERHYNLLKVAIERDTGIKCLGYLSANPDIYFESRHLGLIPTVEIENLRQKIEILAEMVEYTIDLDQIIEIAENASAVGYELVPLEKKPKKINLGVALDKAFNFYYEDNLDLLQQLGANLVFFSPLIDKELPKGLHGLYFGGGFPEVFAHELEQNSSIKYEIKRAIENGLPTYAECGGLMYLTKAITTLEGNRYEMVGVFDTQARMTKRLQRFGYVNVDIEGPCTITNGSSRVRAHEFHRSVIDDNQGCIHSFTVTKSNNEENAWKCGLKRFNTLGAYAHIHFYSDSRLAEDFVDNCKRFKDRSEDNEK